MTAANQYCWCGTQHSSVRVSWEDFNLYWFKHSLPAFVIQYAPFFEDVNLRQVRAETDPSSPVSYAQASPDLQFSTTLSVVIKTELSSCGRVETIDSDWWHGMDFKYTRPCIHLPISPMIHNWKECFQSGRRMKLRSNIDDGFWKPATLNRHSSTPIVILFPLTLHR